MYRVRLVTYDNRLIDIVGDCIYKDIDRLTQSKTYALFDFEHRVTYKFCLSNYKDVDIYAADAPVLRPDFWG